MRLPVRITTSRCWSWDRRSLHVKWWSAGSLLVTKSMPLQQWSTPFIARRTRRAGCDWTWQYYRHIPRQYDHFARLLNHVSGRFWTSQWDMETFHRDLRAPLGTFFLFPISHLSLSLSFSFSFSDFLDAFESSRRHLFFRNHFLRPAIRGVISVQSHSSFAGPSPPSHWHISGAAVEALVPQMAQSSSP